MRARTYKMQDKFIFLFCVYQHPIGVDVAITMAFVLTVQRMIPVFLRQRLASPQESDYSFCLVRVKTEFHCLLHVPVETR